VPAAKATMQAYVRRYPAFDRSEQLALLTVRVGAALAIASIRLYFTY
jgi:hypothetical protein